MTLLDTGERLETLEGFHALAKNSKGEDVAISASHEAIKDYGWDTIFDAASKKYNAGKTEPSTSPPLVRVTTSDCAEA